MSLGHHTHTQIRFYRGDLPYTNYVIHIIIVTMSCHKWHLWLPLGAYGTYLFIYPLDMYLYHCQFILVFKTTLEKAALQIIVSFKSDTGKVSAYSTASLFSTVSFSFSFERANGSSRIAEAEIFSFLATIYNSHSMKERRLRSIGRGMKVWNKGMK